MAAATTQIHPPNPVVKNGPTRSNLVCFSFAAYSKAIIRHLESMDIPTLPGLTDQEFSSIESTFRFTFPPDLRSILQEGLPVHPSFPNWRSSSPQQLNLPLLSLSKNIKLHNFWSHSWGPKPSNPNEALALFKKLFTTAPLLVPIYRNCYIPSTPNVVGNPVFYVDGEKVRILSFDITSFFQEVEFLRRDEVFRPFMRKNKVVNKKVPAWAATAARRIEFWTDVAERGRKVSAREVTTGWWCSRVDERVEDDFGLGGCLEEVFWRLRDGGWREEEVREMMMMDGCDLSQSKYKSGTRLFVDGVDSAWHVRILSFVLLRSGWSREDVVYSLDLDDIIDGEEQPFLELQPPSSY